MRRQDAFTRSSKAVRTVTFHNLTLLPGSMLPYLESCQETANKLPQNGVLLVLPTDNPTQKQILLAVAKLLAAEGHQVSVLPAEEVSRSSPYVQSKLDL